MPRSVAVMIAAERRDIQQRIGNGAPPNLVIRPQDQYLAGAWSPLDVLAVMWSLGAGSTLPLLSVHDAALRARRLRAASSGKWLCPGTSHLSHGL